MFFPSSVAFGIFHNNSAMRKVEFGQYLIGMSWKLTGRGEEAFGAEGTPWVDSVGKECLLFGGKWQ